MSKFIFIILLAFSLLFSTHTNVQSITKPTQDSEELRLQDMLMLFLTPHIIETVGVYYYPHVLNFKPYVVPWKIEVIHTRRVNSFRGFLLEITLIVEPVEGGIIPQWARTE
ncbi:DUF3888 domain-containing protein [Fredinandcohnia salidurans]|uniref:DUF3888 domain-containing protein n=1 Tax=Fredinandcohnia salidurans TaxID=2595041 RepID=A0ABW4MS12_9BACI